MKFIDTHTHIDGKEFADDLPQVMQRAREAGVIKMFVPAIDLSSIETVMQTCRDYPDFAYPMMGLHPEEVKSDYKEVLETDARFH
jgi:TatD DNase family protein